MTYKVQSGGNKGLKKHRLSESRLSKQSVSLASMELTYSVFFPDSRFLASSS